MKHSDYVRHDAVALAGLVRRGELAPDEPLETAIAATEAIDPRIHAVVHRFYDLARAQLRTVAGDAPLRGVPFLLKELGLHMTGTPLTNRPRDLFPLLQLVGHPMGKSFLSFAKRYCAAYHNGYGWVSDGASNLMSSRPDSFWLPGAGVARRARTFLLRSGASGS